MVPARGGNFACPEQTAGGLKNPCKLPDPNLIPAVLFRLNRKGKKELCVSSLRSLPAFLFAHPSLASLHSFVGSLLPVPSLPTGPSSSAPGTRAGSLSGRALLPRPKNNRDPFGIHRIPTINILRAAATQAALDIKDLAIEAGAHAIEK